MDIVAEFFTRILGVALFLPAFAIVILVVNSIDSSVSATKQNYANDSVYSEASLEASDESTISRMEVLSMLLRSPGRNILVRDDVSGYTLTIMAGAGVDSILTIEKDGILDGEKESKTINFGKERWNLDKIELDEYLQAQTYKVSNITFSDGTLQSVLFYGSE